MVCPMCITTAIVSNIPLISIAVSGAAAAKIKNHIEQNKVKQTTCNKINRHTYNVEPVKIEKETDI